MNTKVHNPSDKEVALLFRGQKYTIGAGSTESYPEDVATQFVTIFGFMTIEGHGTVETPVEVTEVATELAEEPKKVTKPKAKKK